jgi:hypothetical protein
MRFSTIYGDIHICAYAETEALPMKRTEHLTDLGLDGTIILKYIVRELLRRIWT